MVVPFQIYGQSIHLSQVESKIKSAMLTYMIHYFAEGAKYLKMATLFGSEPDPIIKNLRKGP